MKRVLKTLIALILFININMITIFANDLTVIENILNDIGFSQIYSENIVNYVGDLKLSQKEINTILEDSKDIMNIIGDRRSVKQFKVSELTNIYSEVKSIAKELNLDISYNLATGKVKIADKATKELLFEGTLSELNKYYKNLSQMTLSEDVVEIATNITSEILYQNDVENIAEIDKLLQGDNWTDNTNDSTDKLANSDVEDNLDDESSSKELKNIDTKTNPNRFNMVDFLFLIGGAIIIALIIKLLLS